MGHLRGYASKSDRLIAVVQLSSVLVPAATLMFVATKPDAHSILTFLIFGLWVLAGALIFRISSKSIGFTLTWLFGYHFIFAIAQLTILDYATPLLFLWALLAVSSYITLGFFGSVASLSLMVIVGIIDTQAAVSTAMMLENLQYSLVTFIASVMSISVLRGIDLDQARIDSARRQSELQQERLETLVNNLADAIVSLDESGRILLYNAALLNLLDTNQALDDEFIDDVLKLRSKSDEKYMLARELPQIRAVTILDDLHSAISGEQTRLELTISPIRASFDVDTSARTVGWIVIIRDVTKSKSLEEERDEFISVVSHELRTPITVAEGTISNAQIMLEQHNSSAAKVRDSMRLAHDQIVFLSRMVNDLSTLSRAERGVADESEVINVDELAQALYAEYEPQAADKGLHLSLHLPSRVGDVQASRLYLKELLQNFITNAIKYTREGDVKIEIKKSRSGDVTFAVSDSGIGISKTDQKRIFEKFYRAEDYRTRETTGTGLGLYVANKLARKLGTTIHMKSRLNHGSTFSITLPSAKRHKKSKHA